MPPLWASSHLYFSIIDYCWSFSAIAQLQCRISLNLHYIRHSQTLDKHGRSQKNRIRHETPINSYATSSRFPNNNWYHIKVYSTISRFLFCTYVAMFTWALRRLFTIGSAETCSSTAKSLAKLWLRLKVCFLPFLLYFKSSKSKESKSIFHLFF